MTAGKSQYVLGKVSVIIPCYNRGKYLGEAIDSVLGQTYRNIELIIVDDGSTDDSLNIARIYSDKITILQHPNGENRGQSASINLGLRSIDGEYVAILDSDDYWILDKLEKQVTFLQDHPDIGLVYGNALMVDADGNKLFRRYGDDHQEKNIDGSVLLDCYFSVPSNSLVRHTVYDLVGGFDESMRAAQDHDMAVRIAEVAKLGFINELMFNYRRHGASISSGHASLRWQNGFRILDNALERHRYPSGVVRQRRAVLHFRVGQCQLQEKKRVKAAGHFLQALVNDPLRSLKVTLGRENVSSPDC